MGTSRTVHIALFRVRLPVDQRLDLGIEAALTRFVDDIDHAAAHFSFPRSCVARAGRTVHTVRTNEGTHMEKFDKIFARAAKRARGTITKTENVGATEARKR
jgi:hypothetical protein